MKISRFNTVGKNHEWIMDFGELNLAEGFYYLEIKNKDTQTTFKVIYNPE